MTLQGAIQELYEMREDTSLPVYYALVLNDVINTLRTDVQEVKHGRWEYKPAPTNALFGFYICSECGAASWASSSPYCPNCGARMDSNAIQHTECVGNALDALDEMGRMSRYIDANKMADELSKVPWYEREDGEQAVRMVKEFSAADVQEVKHGRWEWNESIKTEDMDGWFIDEQGYVCSECGFIGVDNFNYCPNCGSRMDLEGDTE